MILCKFLVVQINGFMRDPDNVGDMQTLDLMHKTLSSALAYYNRLYAHGLFLDRKCAVSTYLDGCRFIAGYCMLANQCLGHLNLFGIKPKIHMWRHTLVQMRQSFERGSKVTLNPLAWNCDPNEDSIGRLSRLSRRLDSRGVSGRILQCFLIKAHILTRRHLGTSR